MFKNQILCTTIIYTDIDFQQSLEQFLFKVLFNALLEMSRQASLNNVKLIAQYTYVNHKICILKFVTTQRNLASFYKP